eukprot:202375_1
MSMDPEKKVHDLKSALQTLTPTDNLKTQKKDNITSSDDLLMAVLGPLGGGLPEICFGSDQKDSSDDLKEKFDGLTSRKEGIRIKGDERQRKRAKITSSCRENIGTTFNRRIDRLCEIGDDPSESILLSDHSPATTDSKMASSPLFQSDMSGELRRAEVVEDVLPHNVTQIQSLEGMLGCPRLLNSHEIYRTLNSPTVTRMQIRR